MKTRQTVVLGVLLASVTIGIAFAVESKKDDAYTCKAAKLTSINCQKSNNTECVTDSGSSEGEIILSNPKSPVARILYAKGSDAFNMKRLSVTKDSKTYYLATIGEMGGMAFYMWLPETKRLFEIKAHTLWGDYSSTTLYQCQNK